MAITGSNLYKEIKPILTKELNSGQAFLLELGTTISTYITTNDLLEGAYVGIIPGTPPVPSTLVVATGYMAPIINILPEPLRTDNWISWLKRSLTDNIGLTWAITPLDPQHVFTPTIIKPIYAVTETYFDTLGNLQDVHSAYGIWALLSDLIITCILSAIERITPVAATAIDGSSGTITWIPTDIPELTHNFLIKVHYDASNTKLVKWLKDHGIDVEHAQGEVSIPLDAVAYQEAIITWKALKGITKDCKLYKVQDDSEEIYLASGMDL